MNEARSRAQNFTPSDNEPYARSFFADQFETEANFYAHYEHTGPEIWAQTHGRLDAFVAGTGTGGTLAGVSAFLKEKSSANRESSILTVAAEPQGSGVYNRIKYGVMYSATEAEGTRRRHQVDTVVEGIGLNRLTHNIEMGLPFIDTAERVTDDEAVRMSRWLSTHDGLFVGSSSAVQCVAATRIALQLKQRMAQTHPGIRPVVVTILYVQIHSHAGPTLVHDTCPNSRTMQQCASVDCVSTQTSAIFCKSKSACTAQAAGAAAHSCADVVARAFAGAVAHT